MAQINQARVDCLLSLLRPERLTRITDVGANPVHVPAYSALHKMGGCEVWGFEPLPEAFERLEAAAGANEHVLPYAIGDGQLGKLHVCASGPFSSLYAPNIKTLDHLGRWHKAMRLVEAIPLQTHRLDDLADMPKPDLLKIDVQGAELDVFRNGVSKLSEAVAVISEVAFVPLYQNQPLFHHQAAELAEQGFDMMKFLSLKSKCLGSPLMKNLQWHQHQNQCIDGDALFIRRLYEPESWNPEALKHLAILSDAVFGCFDLTLKCLDILHQRGILDAAQIQPYLRQVPFHK